MAHLRRSLKAWLAALLLLAAGHALAQTDYSLYGIADFSYGRFEPSGFEPRYQFNSNSLSASFIGVELKQGFESGWTIGTDLEAFVRFQDFQMGRTSQDPALSRNAFAFVQNPTYGTLRAGRLQTLLFDTTTRFNALGNSTVFSPAMHQLFTSGNLEGVDEDFYWNRAVGYASPKLFESVNANVMYGRGPKGRTSDLAAANVVYSSGLLAAALSWQRVHFNDGIQDLSQESTWQLGATYNFGLARLFGLYTHTDDVGLGVKSNLTSAGLTVPVGPGTLAVQAGLTTAKGDAVDRRHASLSGAYIYPFDSLTDFYVIGMEDRIRGQTRGFSAAVGVRYKLNFVR
jgi:predicted porin